MEIAERLFEKYGDLFIHRWDVHAIQQEQGGYHPVQHSITRQLVRDHLDGKVTLGVYALGQDNRARWAVIDSDVEEGLSDLQGLWVEFRQLRIPSYLEASRRGGHLWLFYEPMAARALWYCTHWLLKRTGFQKRVEVIPKQVKLNPGGVGSLMRAPLGVHLISNKRYGFVNPLTLKSIGWDVIDQLEYLETFEHVPSFRVAELLAEGLAYLSTNRPKTGARSGPSRNG